MELIMVQPKQNIVQTVKQYSKQLFSFIRSKVSTNEDAEDISQEVWYQLSRVVDFTEIESFSGWLYQVARNKITDKYRKKTNESLEDFAYEDEDGDINFRQLLLMDNASTPDDAFFKEMFWEELLRALDELPENQRNVFIWNELEDSTLQEIADKTGDNLKTIISRKGYAVKHLRKRLKALYNELNNL
jgi:RNA polymerase sigma factor (sigma-70 family)